MKTKVFPLLVMVFLFFSTVFPAHASSPGPTAAMPQAGIVVKNVTPQADLTKAIHPAGGRVRVIVELRDPPLAAYRGGIQNFAATSPKATGALSLDANAPASQAYLGYLQTTQAQFTTQVTAAFPTARVDAGYQTIFNGVSMEIDESQATSLSKLAQVKRIYPDLLKTASLDASLPWIHAPDLWSLLGGQAGAGKGVFVADVDTGLRIANPMFSGDSFSAPSNWSQPKDDFCAQHPSDPQFQCNHKVLVARFYAPPAGFPLSSMEVSSPLDIDGHGSHTAGTAVGNIVTVPGFNINISGVAPGAYLMVYKALFETSAGGASGSDSMLIAALDDAVRDGANVINNSWGGAAGGDPNSTPYPSVIKNAKDAGVLMVFAAGNDGPSEDTIGCPGCVADALTVGASSDNRLFVTTLSADSVTPTMTIPPALINMTGESVTPTAATGPTVDLAVEGNPDPLACVGPFPAGSVAGKLVIVERGTCPLVTKVTNVAAGGAIGVVIRNVVGGLTNLALISGPIPVIHVDQATGDAIVSFLTAVKASGGSATFTIHGPAQRVLTGQGDVVASFSSAGPNGDPDVLKPDITAPGIDILSAYSGALTGQPDPVFTFLQGTSMATPHVTGSAALLKQLHPAWTPDQIKTVLTSTSVQALTNPDGKTAATPFDMGAGRLDLGQAAKAGLTFDQSSYATGNCVLACSWTQNLTNVSPSTLTWTVQVSAPTDMPITVSPTSVTLDSGASQAFTVTVNSSAMDPNQYEFGNITWVETTGAYTSAHLPVAVAPGTATNPTSFTKSADQFTAQPGKTLTYTLQVANQYPRETTFDLTDNLPEGAVLVPGSLPADLAQAGSQLTSTFTLPGLVANLTPTGMPTLYSSISGQLGTIDLNIFCQAGCDDEAFDISGVDYYYMGVHYNKIGVSTNGYLMAGGSTSATSIPQKMPDPAAPNNVIAPLWTDLALGPSGGGDLLVGGDETHTVIEWLNAQQFGSQSTTYSFQVWITNGTNQITIAYGHLPSSNTVKQFDAAVGMENRDGTAGMSQYFRLTMASGTVSGGTLPTVGTDLLAQNQVSMNTISFPVQVSAQFLSGGKLVNIATLTNDFNTDTQTAVAITPVIPISPGGELLRFHVMLPVISNQK